MILDVKKDNKFFWKKSRFQRVPLEKRSIRKCWYHVKVKKKKRPVLCFQISNGTQFHEHALSSSPKEQLLEQLLFIWIAETF